MRYVIRNKNGQYIGVDQSSGGYPWVVSADALAYDVMRWISLDDTKRYVGKFKIMPVNDGWEICELHCEVKPVKF